MAPRETTALGAEDEVAAAPPAAAPPAGWTRGQIVVATTIIGATSVVNMLDRQVISILVEPIKREFALSDTQMGLLTGFGFAVPYALAAFPIALLIDRSSRKWILGGMLALWSICTILSGFAASFVSLLAARIGVAVGESAAQPAQSSLLSDLFLGPRLATAMSILPIGGAVGAALALTIGGVVSDQYGWRAAFLVTGVPGLLLAAAVFQYFREPARQTISQSREASRPEPFRAVFRYLLSLRSFVLLAIANMMAGFSGYVFLVWTPSLVARVHGMPLREIGLWLGPCAAIGMVAGAALGGRLGSTLGSRDMAWNAQIGGAACLAGFPFGLLLAFAPNAAGAIAGAVLATTFNVVYLAPSGALVQMIAPARMRGSAVAFLGFWQTIAGVGLGPVLVGAISDALAPSYGEASLRYAVAVGSVGCAIAGAALLGAAAHVKADLATTARRDQASEA